MSDHCTTFSTSVSMLPVFHDYKMLGAGAESVDREELETIKTTLSKSLVANRSRNRSRSESGRWGQGGLVCLILRWEKLQYICNNPEGNSLGEGEGKKKKEKGEVSLGKQEVIGHSTWRVEGGLAMGAQRVHLLYQVERRSWSVEVCGLSLLLAPVYLVK